VRPPLPPLEAELSPDSSDTLSEKAESLSGLSVRAPLLAERSSLSVSLRNETRCSAPDVKDGVRRCPGSLFTGSFFLSVRSSSDCRLMASWHSDSS